jgi:membrane fusion protein, heavy metal efflux system
MNAAHRFGRLLLSILLALSVGSCHADTRSARPDSARSAQKAEGDREALIELTPEARAAISLTTETVGYGTLNQKLATTAVIKPNEYRIAHVSPRIPGKAVDVPAKLGDVVKAGEVLAELDSIELGERKAAFLEAKVNLEVARRNYQRESNLFKQQISSEKEYLEAKGTFERSEAAYRAAREALRLVGLSDDEIDGLTWGGSGRHAFSYFPLMSPFSGTVIARHITLGELVRPEDTPFTIADLSTVWVLVDVYERDLARVAKGDPVLIRVDAYPGETFQGRIAYLSNTVQTATRTAEARVEVANLDGRLRPGMFANVEVALHPHATPSSIVIPVDAVQRVHEKPIAFVEQKPGAYMVRQLSLGQSSQAQVEVLSGLAAHERVVTKGAFYLKSALLKQEIGGQD